MEYVIETQDLTKKYGQYAAVNQANFNLIKGEILGLVGRNGAGKTTLMKMIMGLSRPHSGGISILNSKGSADIHKARKQIGFMMEPNFYPYLSAKENLEVTRKYKGIKDKKEVDRVLKLVELDGVKKPFKQFSMGMRQRLGVANALMGNPDVVLLDEPINGLDPQGIVEFRELIVKLNQEQKITFMISSHILAELDLMAQRFAFIDKGKLLEQITHEDLVKKCQNSLIVNTNDNQKAIEILKNQMDLGRYEMNDDHEIVLFDHVDHPSQISKILFDAGLELSRLNVNHATLENYFLNLVEENQHA